MTEDLSYLEMVVIWSIHKLEKVSDIKLASITKVSLEEIKSTIKELMYKEYITLDKNNDFVLTAKAFNSIPTFPDEIKNMKLTDDEESPQSSQSPNQNTQYNQQQYGPSPQVIEIKTQEKKGSIGLGALATFLISAIFSFIPVIGWLSSFFGGLVGGLIARGVGRGALAGFLGIFSAVIIVAIILGIISSEIGLGFMSGAMIGGFGAGIIFSIDIILATIGGLIGGAIKR